MTTERSGRRAMMTARVAGIRWACVLTLLAAASCTTVDGGDKQRDAGEDAHNAMIQTDHPPLAQFTGHADPHTGLLVIDTLQPATGEVGQQAQAITNLNVATGTGAVPPDSVRLVVSNTRSGMTGCGQADSICSDVQIQSGYGVAIPNVYSEITTMVPATGNEAINSAPSAFGLSNVLGLWSYGTLAATGSATQTWSFNALSGSGFTFQGRVVGDLGFANYTLTPGSTTFINACAQSGATTGLVPSADDSTTAVTLPFSFTYYGYSGTSAWISSNGMLGIGSTASSAYFNACMPSATIPAGVVMPFWDDLTTRSTGVCTATVGTYPNRQFVITWSDADFYPRNGTAHLTFSVILNEGTNAIDFVYSSLTSSDSTQLARAAGSSATIGLWSGTVGAENSCNSVSLPTTPVALHFTPHTCPTGQHSCGGTCVVDSATANCGAICSACSTVGGTATCDSYLCSLNCNAGYHACGSTCALDTSVATCGTSCTPCVVIPNSTATCSSGVCGHACNAGTHTCSGACAINTSTLNCGSSCTPCAVPANASATCDGTTCGYTCNSGWGDCNGSAADGCETNTGNSLTNCGGCGMTCAGSNVVGSACVAGSCTGTCAAGFADCNNNLRIDGCEVNTSTSVANCGACGSSCSGANVTGSACVGGNCTGTCAAGFGDCNSNLRLDGCELATTTTANCGGCGTACSGLNVVGSACTGGACTGTCATGFANCNGNLRLDGCEVNLNTDSSHCGTCSTTCAIGAACTVGVCCTAPTTYCGGSCVNTFTDINNCGGCGVRCTGSQICSNGTCCGAGTTSCSGTCTNLTTSVTNCGACGNVCPTPANGSATCSASTCGVVCNAGYSASGGMCCPTGTVNCGGVCVNTATSSTNCGSCGSTCPGGTSCSSGVCCGTGTTNCSGVCVNTSTSISNCGACGTVCPSPANGAAVCTGSCGISCNTGYLLCSGSCVNNTHAACTAPTIASFKDCNATGVSAVNAQSYCGRISASCGIQSVSSGMPAAQFSAYCGVASSGTYSGKCVCFLYSSGSSHTAGSVYVGTTGTCSTTTVTSGTLLATCSVN